MIWHEISPLVTSIGEALPEVDGMALVAGFVGDNLDDLDEDERAMVSRAVLKRQREFSTGRKLARLAMGYLDLPGDVIGRDSQRRPIRHRSAHLAFDDCVPDFSGKRSRRL